MKITFNKNSKFYIRPKKKKPKRRKSTKVQRLNRRKTYKEKRKNGFVPPWHIKERQELIDSYFDRTQKDLTYISENPEILKKHIKFIKLSRIYIYEPIKHLVKLFRKKAGRAPYMFRDFDVLYKDIYDQWLYLINVCYNKKHRLYKYFGGRGIRLSREFLSSKNFCIWCLENNFVKAPFAYNQYLQRKDNTKSFSPDNCFVISEKDIHTGKTLKIALQNIALLKQYEESHDPSVSFLTFYTRYYSYCLPFDAASSMPVNKKDTYFVFSPQKFYDSVADENCCSKAAFLLRVKYIYLNENMTLRPYEVIKENYSNAAEAAMFNTEAYTTRYYKNSKRVNFINNENNANINVNNEDNNNYDVYNNYDDYNDR